MNKKIIFLSLLLMGFGMMSVSMTQAYANISLQPGFSGTVLVTFPNGEIQLIEPGQPIPNIPADSILQVFKGQLTVTTDKGESVKVSCLEQSAKVEGASSVNLSCAEKSEDSGLLKVLKGAASLLKGEEIISTVKEGAEYLIKVKNEKSAPPTGAGETVDGTPVGGNLADPPPSDSRSLQSSPAQ